MRQFIDLVESGQASEILRCKITARGLQDQMRELDGDPEVLQKMKDAMTAVQLYLESLYKWKSKPG